MSDPLLQLAQTYASDADDVSPAATLARGYLLQLQSVAEHEKRYSELYKRFNSQTHELAGLRENAANRSPRIPSEPELTITCDRPGCTTLPLIRKVAPPDWALETWLHGLGWWSYGETHYCPNCKEVGQ